MGELSRININNVNYDLKDDGAVASARYNSTSHNIEFLNDLNMVVATLDATPFIKDGMVDDVKIENGNLVIVFNTDAGKETISIPLTDIFNPDNYYTKTQVDSKLALKYEKPSGGIPETDMAVSVQEKLGLEERLLSGETVAALAENLEAWADQKAIATPDTYTDAVRTTGGDIPIETSAGSKLESIKPVAGSRWKAKMLFNGSYNMLNAAKWGAANSQPYVGGVGGDFVYFLVPKLTLGTFGTADENNGLLFTDEGGVNIQPATVYYKPLGNAVPSSATDGTSVSPTSVSYDGNTYKTYETSGAGWLIVPKTIYDNDVCAHIAWEDWYDKHVSLNEPNTNPEAVLGILMLEGLLALAHSNKYLLGVNDEVCDNVVFGDTSATITHMVDEIEIAANAWTNAATGESDSQGNTLYRHSATVSGIKNGGAACVEGEDGGIPLTVNGTTVSYIDTNATAPASVVFYQIPTEVETTKSYSDTVFNGSNINTETGVLPINDCSIEAQVGMDGEANITVKYAKNIVDQVAINATVDVPQIKKQVEEHEERITELEDTAVRTGSYDASVAVGLADNFKGDTIVDAEFYKRKTGGTQSVGSGIAAIKEVRGKSIVWNQIYTGYRDNNFNGVTITLEDGISHANGTSVSAPQDVIIRTGEASSFQVGHIYLYVFNTYSEYFASWVNGYTTVNYNSFKKRITKTASNSPSIHLRVKPDSEINNAIFNIQLFDLTLMFGEGNEPATVEEFEKMFPLGYYNYNKGEIIPFAGQNLVTNGFNQWDEQWELGYYDNSGAPVSGKINIRSKNYIRVFPSTTYYVKTDGNELYYCKYDADKKFIERAHINNGSFVTSANTAYIRFNMAAVYGTTYNNDVCINISNPDRNGTYEPYEKHTLPLDPSQWRDKNGELVFPYGGMHGVGTAYDYAKVDADGYIRKVVRCVGQVDLGSLSWIYQIDYPDTGSLFRTETPNNLKVSTGEICSRYLVVDYQYFVANNNVATLKLASGYLYIKDSSYTDATTFTSAMNGVPLIYELAEPVEVELATPVYAKYLVDKDGTEEITPANGQEPYTTPSNISILYAMDARGEIKNLPKNYLSKESAENMLNAMVSAGVIASYTMTWDSTNNRYVFVITKPA